MVIPAGTRVPLSLAQAISTKNAREGDPVYAQTTFPFVLNERILIPAGTYIQGKITHVERAGRSKKRDTGKRVEDAAKGAAVGGTVGSVGGLAAGGLNGARYGGLAGIAGGVAWALLKHGPEVKLDVGTSIEMEIQRDVPIDATRIQVARSGS